jgi:hypothetical protein
MSLRTALRLSITTLQRVVALIRGALTTQDNRTLTTQDNRTIVTQQSDN